MVKGLNRKTGDSKMDNARLARKLVKLAKELTSYGRRPTDPEDVYVDEDEDSGMWAVFGLDSGFAYSTHADEYDAERAAKKLQKEMDRRM